MQIKKISETIDKRGIKVLVYGDAGAGKTRLIATLPGRVLVVSAEAGLLSLSGHVDDEERFDVVEVDNIDDLRAVYTACKASPEHDWIVLDSISEIAEQCLTAAKAATKDPRQAYGAVIDEVTKLLRAFRDLTCGVYFSAKQNRDKDEATSRVSYGIAMPGAKLGSAVPFLFDEVLRLVVVEDPDTKEPIRWLQTTTTRDSVAKDRSGKLAPYEPADLGAIVAKIRGASTT